MKEEGTLCFGETKVAHERKEVMHVFVLHVFDHEGVAMLKI